MSAALELEGVSVRLGGRVVLDAVSLHVAAGEVLGVLGANGSGKTTLMRAALGLQRLAVGTARLGGEAVEGLSERQRAALAGYLPQERRVGWNLPAWRVAALGAVTRPPAQAHATALAALEEVGMTPLAERGVLDMSGGERARVLIARLLATGAPLLAADEPAAGLDPDAQLLVLERLRGRAGAGTAVMVSLHDLTLAARACDRLAVLAHGRLAALGRPREALSREVLRHAFGLDGEVVETPAGPVVAAKRGE
ncbi:MAG TPA: ABC transporter ATP-binding protein [Caulobacteraceae bacterium]|nr:ABC transporter ATP-binding protein [Caulobacteraceae bacterium]